MNMTYDDDGSPSCNNESYDPVDVELAYSDDIWDQLPSDCSPDSIDYLDATTYNYQTLTGQ